MSKPIDLTGQRFGKLTVVERLPEFRKRTKYRCHCDCGNERTIPNSHLTQGIISSCGCQRAKPYEFRRTAGRKTVLNKLWANYRNKAKKRNFSWTLTKEQFVKLMSACCHYCGYLDVSGIMGIDRVNSREGYELSNCVSCCKDCNFAKNDRTLEEFFSWLNRISEFQKGFTK